MFLLQVLLISSFQLLNQFTYGWDLAVASEGQLDLISSYGQRQRLITSPELTEARGLALDFKNQRLFFSNAKPHNGKSLFSLNLLETNKTEIVPFVSSRYGGEHIQSLAYDPENTTLYWTDNEALAIFWARVIDNEEDWPVSGKVLHQFTLEIPQGLAIDPCVRKLFWTNVNHRSPTIETSNLDGSDKEVLVSQGLYQPLGLTLDTTRQQIYWGNDLEGIHFTLDRCDYNGDNREELFRGTKHMPFSVALLGNTLFWSDWMHDAIWSVDLSVDQKNRREREVLKFNQRPPFGILSNHNRSCNDVQSDQTTPQTIPRKQTTSSPQVTPKPQTTPKTQTESPVTSPTSSTTEAVTTQSPLYCLAGGTFGSSGECDCRAGYEGTRCERDLCLNFCLHGGTCKSGSPPSCSCTTGRTGERCEIDPCREFCLNGGTCEVIALEATCHCNTNFSGARCEVKRDIAGEHCDCLEGGDKPCVCEFPEFLGNLTVGNSSSLCAFTPQSPINLFVISLASVCAGLLAVIVALGWRVAKLSRRPRIRRRVVVSRRDMPVSGKSEEQSERGAPNGLSSDTCEITIENCCNMNICETPCFEPPVRTPGKKSKKEEKKNLLSDMEEPDSADGQN